MPGVSFVVSPGQKKRGAFESALCASGVLRRALTCVCGPGAASHERDHRQCRKRNVFSSRITGRKPQPPRHAAAPARLAHCNLHASRTPSPSAVRLHGREILTAWTYWCAMPLLSCTGARCAMPLLSLCTRTKCVRSHIYLR